MAIKVTPRTVVPAQTRISNYRRKKDEGISQKSYQVKVDAADAEGRLSVFGDLSDLDAAVGTILGRHKVLAWMRVIYLAFARELYRFYRKYGFLEPNLVTALIVKYRTLAPLDEDILREIVELFTAPATAAAPAAAAITL